MWSLKQVFPYSMEVATKTGFTVVVEFLISLSIRPTKSTYSGIQPYCTTHDICVLCNAIILFDPRYIRSLECLHIVRPKIFQYIGMAPYCTTHNSTYSEMPPYCKTLDIYIPWNSTILYDPRYLRILECHYIVLPKIYAYSGMPLYCTTHDIYVLWNAIILFDPRYLRTLECHYIV
jgi:hypothetical protein